MPVLYGSLPVQQGCGHNKEVNWWVTGQRILLFKAIPFLFRQMAIRPWWEDILTMAVSVLPGFIPVQQGYGHNREASWLEVGLWVVLFKAIPFPFQRMEIRQLLEDILITVLQALPGSLPVHLGYGYNREANWLAMGQ